MLNILSQLGFSCCLQVNKRAKTLLLQQ